MLNNGVVGPYDRPRITSSDASILSSIDLGLMMFPPAMPKFPFKSPYSPAFVFLLIVFLGGKRWSLNAVVICISLVTHEVENFFMFIG